MRVLGSNVKVDITSNGELERRPKKQSIGINKKEDKFKNSVVDAYTNYTREGLIEGELERQIIGVTKEQLEEMLKEENRNIQTDKNRYWITIDDICYEFKIISKDDTEEKKPKSNDQVLLDMTNECIEREQKRLDKVFRDWSMKKDILYPNLGKNAMIKLEDIIKKKEEERMDERKDFKQS